MKKLLAIIGLVFISWSFICLAQVPAASVAPSVAAVVVAPVVPVVASPGILDFIKANWGQIAFALSWLIEGVFYFSPSIKANSFLEQVESWLKGQAVPPTV